jgi:hypothetical protein
MTEPTRESGPRLAAFSVTSIATGGFNILLQTYLPAFYATAIGMDLATVGLVFMISRLWSAAADPMIGWASDHTRTRIGRRNGGGGDRPASGGAVGVRPALFWERRLGRHVPVLRDWAGGGACIVDRRHLLAGQERAWGAGRSRRLAIGLIRDRQPSQDS